MNNNDKITFGKMIHYLKSSMGYFGSKTGIVARTDTCDALLAERI